MSLAEMKLAAITEIIKITDEKALREILEHLAKVSIRDNPVFNADAFFGKASEKYDDVLQKLAQ
jgi:predicted transcriptional regulator